MNLNMDTDTLAMLSIVVFFALIIVTAVLIFLLLFKQGKFVKKTWAFIGVQIITIVHCVIRLVITIGGSNNLVGKVLAVLFILGVIGTVYIKDWKNNFLVARTAAIVLMIASIINFFCI